MYTVTCHTVTCHTPDQCGFTDQTDEGAATAFVNLPQLASAEHEVGVLYECQCHCQYDTHYE